MHNLSHFQILVEEKIKKLPFPAQPSDLYDPIRYMLGLGGKRIRPALVLMSCEMFGGEMTHALNPAIGVEVFHNFTLLHDDIMDKAPLRRSQPTVHSRWNTDVAILSGDAMFAEACRLMTLTDEQVALPLMQSFLAAALRVCEGQQWDMTFQAAEDVGIPDYLQMIEAKTAALLAFSLQAGAIIAGASDKDAQHAYAFGKNLGIAFQLHDDILDVYGEERKTGKQTGGDINANKKTYLLLKALEIATKSQLEELRHWMSMEKFEPQQKVMAVRNIFDQCGVKALSESAMEEYFQKAISALDAISVSPEKKTALAGLARQLMVREK